MLLQFTILRNQLYTNIAITYSTEKLALVSKIYPSHVCCCSTVKTPQNSSRTTHSRPAIWSPLVFLKTFSLCFVLYIKFMHANHSKTPNQLSISQLYYSLVFNNKSREKLCCRKTMCFKITLNETTNIVKVKGNVMKKVEIRQQ